MSDLHEDTVEHNNETKTEICNSGATQCSPLNPNTNGDNYNSAENISITQNSGSCEHGCVDRMEMSGGNHICLL